MTRDPGYGPPITGPAPLDRWCRAKNRVMTQSQYRILDAFGALPVNSFAGRWFARVARRAFGAYLYSLKLEVNDYCELNCAMCYVRRGRRDLSRDTIRRILSSLRSCGVRLEILGGEPLLRPDIAGIVSEAKNLARSPFISLYTNAVSASAEKSRVLKSVGLDAAIVSLVSHDPDVHDRFTGISGSWHKTVAGIRNLREAEVEVYTFSAVHRDNIYSLAALDRFVRRELDAHALFYQYIPQQPDDPLVVDPRNWHKAKHWALATRNPDHADFVRRFYLLTGNACSGGNFVLTVKVDGSVQPCPFVDDVPLGSVLVRDIWDIYQHRYDRTGLLEFKQTPAECRDCSHRSVCTGGCRAGNGALRGCYGLRDYLCLGPYSDPITRESVTDRVPSFF